MIQELHRKQPDVTSSLRSSPTPNNVGNILANWIEYSNYASNQFSEDVFTMSAETALKDAFGIYTYEVKHSDFGKLEQQLERAIDPDNRQIPEGEKPRNMVNMYNFQNMRKGRYGEDYKFRDAAYVEFSPAPELTEEMQKRGYGRKGMVTISKPGKDQHGNSKEDVAQFWFDDFPFEEWSELLYEIDAKNPDENPIRVGKYNTQNLAMRKDTDIMNRSGFLLDEQETILFNFLKSKGVSDLNPDIMNKIFQVKNEMKHQIENDIRPDIEQALVKLLSNTSGNTSIIDGDMIQISEKIASMSAAVRMYIRDNFGINFDNLSKTLSYNDFINLDTRNRIDIMALNNYKFDFCGGSQDFNKNSYSMFGDMSGKQLLGKLDEKKHYVCTQCGKVHNIDVDRGIFVEQCDCGFRVPRCA